jgi:hypothetical protein
VPATAVRLEARSPAGVVLLAGRDEHPAVLRSRCAAGELVRVVDGVYLPADLAAWPVARARAVRTLLRADLVAGLATSVWCRGGPGRTPREPDVEHAGACTDAHELDLLAPPDLGARGRDGVRLRLVPLAGDEVERIHGSPATTAVRTAADLVLWGTGRDDAALAWLWEHGTDPAAVAEDLTARGPVPGLTRAGRVLRAARAGEPAPLSRHRLAARLSCCRGVR